MGNLCLKWVGQLWQSELLFPWGICSKNAGLQGSTLSGHRMTTGFGLFELPTLSYYSLGWVIWIDNKADNLTRFRIPWSEIMKTFLTIT